MLFFLRNLSAALQLRRNRWASVAMDRRQRWALNCALSLGRSTKRGRTVLEDCFLSLKKKKGIHHGPKGTVIFFSVHCCLRGQRYSMILSSNPCMCRSISQRFSKCIYTAAGVEIDKYLAAAQELKLLGYFPFSLSLRYLLLSVFPPVFSCNNKPRSVSNRCRCEFGFDCTFVSRFKMR